MKPVYDTTPGGPSGGVVCAVSAPGRQVSVRGRVQRRRRLPFRVWPTRWRGLTRVCWVGQGGGEQDQSP